MQINDDNQPLYLDQLREKKPRKFVLLKIFLACLLFLTVVCVILAFMLLHKPDDYNPPPSPPDEYVSQYLTNYISTEIYNGAQRQEPFDLIVTEEGINDIIARSGWPKQMDGISFTVPKTTFTKDLVQLQGVAKLQNFELFITVQASGFLDKQGLLHLSVKQVKVGALNMLPIVHFAAETIYKNEAEERQLSPDDYRTKIMESLLYDIPFEPVFEVEDNKIRITSLVINSGRTILHFEPVP
ncbi:MAG: hypothetical protein JW804_04515 [Sedimentisphaerales bacterium]|nr:hypothetical protein [Sedimentisphaerales bacterium]